MHLLVIINTPSSVVIICMALIFSLSFTFVGLFIYIAGAPSIIYDFLGLGSDDFSLQFIPMVAGLMLGAYLSSQLAHRWPTVKIVTLGFIVMMIAILLNLLQAIYLDISIITVIGGLCINA